MASSQTSADAVLRPADRALRVGDRLRDNDPRMGGGKRVLTITLLRLDFVYATDISGRRFTYSRHRIHTDGKARKSGLSLIAEGQ